MLPQVLLDQVVSLGMRQSLSSQWADRAAHRICSAQTIALFQICYNQVFHITEMGLKFLLQLTLAELHFCIVPVVLYLFSVKLYGIHTMIFFYTFDSVSSVI